MHENGIPLKERKESHSMQTREQLTVSSMGTERPALQTVAAQQYQSWLSAPHSVNGGCESGVRARRGKGLSKL